MIINSQTTCYNHGAIQTGPENNFQLVVQMHYENSIINAPCTGNGSMQLTTSNCWELRNRQEMQFLHPFLQTTEKRTLKGLFIVISFLSLEF